jgi:hypothetical protein
MINIGDGRERSSANHKHIKASKIIDLLVFLTTETTLFPSSMKRLQKIIDCFSIYLSKQTRIHLSDNAKANDVLRTE